MPFTPFSDVLYHTHYPSLHVGDDTVNITTASWNPHNPLQLCCGLADGTIVVWDLDPATLSPTALKRAAELAQAKIVSRRDGEFPPAVSAACDIVPVPVPVPPEESTRKEKADWLPFPLPLKFSGGTSASSSSFSSSSSSATALSKMHRNNLNTCSTGYPPDNRWYLPPPFLRLIDHNTDFSVAPRSALKSISFCPYNPSVLMSSGYESAIKVE